QAVEHPGLRAADRVERAPEDGRDAGVRRISQHSSALALLDLPCKLRPELEVQPFVVDRPGLVRLQVDAVVDVGEEVVQRSLAGLEMEVRHPDEWHTAPAV